MVVAASSVVRAGPAASGREQAVAYLQAAGHEAVHASSVGLSSATDTRILEVARDEGRVIVTADLDYPE